MQVEWFTPPEVIDWARRALGGVIGLDPATSAAAQKIIQAQAAFTKEEDGLHNAAWVRGIRKTLWLNPPWDDTCRAWVRLWVKLLQDEDSEGLLLLPSRTDTSYWQAAAKASRWIYVSKGRIAFCREDGSKAAAPPVGVTLFGKGVQCPRKGSMPFNGTLFTTEDA